jgi:hypothetical protein
VRIVPVLDILSDPIAISQSFRVMQNGSLKIILKGKIKGRSGSITEYSITSLPKNGTITGKVPNLIYRPKNGFSGLDEFKFIVFNGQKKSNLSNISINVMKKLSRFEEWMAKNEINGKIADDFDRDSLTNGMEYVFGTNPKIKTGSSYFPKSFLSFSDPDGDGKKSRYVVLNYRSSKIFLQDSNVAVYVEWRENNKDQWKNARIVKGVIVNTLKNKYPGNIDLVSLHIPRTVTKSGKLMTRIRVASK